MLPVSSVVPSGISEAIATSATVEGKLNPKEPNVISGTKTWVVQSDDKSSTTTYTVNYKLTRKPIPLIITNIEFFQPRYPSPNTWEEIDAQQNDYAIDGNQVKIRATIANPSGVQKTANVQFKEIKENVILPEGNKSATFEPHSEKQVELIWDTSGYAWIEKGGGVQPEINREIEVKVTDDVMTENMEVDPKPVVVVPGLWSNTEAAGKLFDFFKNSPTTWATVLATVDVNKTASQNVPEIDKAVRYLQDRKNAWHVDIVAHSLGGLSARSYIHSEMPQMFDGRPTVTHLVMLGTPNMGTPCADGSDNIFTKIFNRQAPSFREVSTENMKEFNRTVTNRNGTKFSVLISIGYEQTCQVDTPGDGITPSVSAIWKIKDREYSTAKTQHELMPGDPANFKQIVKWLAIPPKGNHAPEVVN